MSGSNKLESVDYRLKNLTNALYLTGDDDVALRTGIDGNIIIEGNVNVPGNIQVYSTPEDPVHVHVTEFGTYGLLADFMPVKGTVSVNNFPTSTTITSGNISVNYGNLSVYSGNIGISIGGSAVSNSNPFSVNVVGNVAGITTMPAIDIKSMPAMSGNVYILNSDTAPANVQYGDTVQMDSSSRLRVSLLGQQWWYVPAVDKDGDLRIQEVFQGTGASSTFIQNLASVRMTSGQTYNANAKLTGSAIRASRRRHKTRPGVAGEWIGIVNFDGLQANVVKRAGLYTAYNGVFVEANATTINSVVRRRLTDGTLVETRTPHTEWNFDKMDGTGPSGINWSEPAITANITAVTNTANIAVSGDGNVYTVTYQLTAGEETRLDVGSKVTASGISPTGYNDTGLVTAIDTVNHRANVSYIAYPGTYSSVSSAKLTHTPFHHLQTFWIDFNGSRTGRVRFGLESSHGRILCHSYDFGALGSQWSSAPALMDRKEIVNTGVPVSFLPSMTVAGSAVGIETNAELNPGFGVAQSITPVVYDKASNEEFALMGIGLRWGEPYQRADLQVNTVDVVDIANINSQQFPVYQYRLVLNPTLTGTIPTPTNVGKASQMWDYDTGVTVSGGINLSGGYFVGTTQLDLKTALNFLNMGSSIDYTSSDLVVLVVKLAYGGSANGSLLASINFTEDL